MTESPQDTKKTKHESLIASRDKLAAALREAYGETGYVTFEVQPEDRFWRFSVGIGFGDGKKKLAVRVQLNDAEFKNLKTHLFEGKTYDEYISLIPREFDGMDVDIRAVSLAVAH